MADFTAASRDFTTEHTEHTEHTEYAESRSERKR